MFTLLGKLLKFMLILQATIFGTWGICSYDLYGEEITKTNKQEGAAHPYQQTKVDLCGPIKANCEGKYNMV